MKKRLLLLLSMGVFLISCSDSSQEYTNAAVDLCKCMHENQFDANDVSNTKMNMGVCLLGSKVNLKDTNMLIEVEKNCPEIREAFVDFLQRMESK